MPSVYYQIGFARSAAVELASSHITVNSVLPGNILTESLQAVGEDYLNAMRKTVPLKRLGKKIIMNNITK